MNPRRRRVIRARHRARRRHDRWLGREANFWGHTLWKEKYFPVGDFKAWLASPMSRSFDPRLGSWYRADKIAQLVNEDHVFLSILKVEDRW